MRFYGSVSHCKQAFATVDFEFVIEVEFAVEVNLPVIFISHSTCILASKGVFLRIMKRLREFLLELMGRGFVHVGMQVAILGIATSGFAVFYMLVRFVSSHAFVYYFTFLLGLLAFSMGFTMLFGKRFLSIGLTAILGTLWAWGLYVSFARLHFAFHNLPPDPDYVIFGLGICLKFVLPMIVMSELINELKFVKQLKIVLLTNIGWICLFSLYYFFPQKPATQAIFSEQIPTQRVPKWLEEGSGIVASRSTSDRLWIHEDGDSKHRIHAFDVSGNYQASFKLPNLPFRDIEDIAIGPGPDQSSDYLYLADIGDNHGLYSFSVIYRFREPSEDSYTLPASAFESLRFRYPKSRHMDAEACFVDPDRGDIYLLSKRQKQTLVFRASPPFFESEITELEQVAVLPFRNVTGADISPDGSEILIKTYRDIYYYHLNSGEEILDAFEKPPVRLPYIKEPQGEAIAWRVDQQGYFTLSERNQGIQPVLYRYMRKE